MITKRDRWWALAVVAGGCLLLAPGLFWGLPVSKAVAGAIRVLDGDIPYRDFWTMYAPGQFYAVAALFRLFGRELIVQGAAVVLIGGLTGGVLFVLLRRLECSRPVALVISAIVVGSFWKTAPELTSYPPALLCILWSVERVVLYFQEEGRTSLFQAGLLLGVAACFKHDIAGYAALATTVTLLITWITGGGNRPDHWLPPLSATLRLAAGALMVFLPVALLVAWKAGPEAWRDLFVFPATDFRGVRTESYAPLLPRWDLFQEWASDWRDLDKARAALTTQSRWILCNLPQWVFVTGLVLLIARRRYLNANARAITIFLLSYLPMFWMAAHVQDNTNVYSMAVFSLCLGGMAWAGHETASRKRKVVRVVLVIGAGIYTVGLMIPPGIRIAEMAGEFSQSQRLGLPGSGGILVSKRDYDVYHPITNFIREHISHDERIYVGVQRHDAIVINNLRFYHLTGRRNCCRYDELHPGVTDRADVQQEIIDAINEHRVRCVVIWKFGWSDKVLDKIKAKNMTAVDGLGAELLDQFIAARFEPLAQYGEYLLMWRKGLPRPEGWH